MPLPVHQERFQELLGNERVFPLFERIVTESYVECAEGYEVEMQALLRLAFELLKESRDRDPAYFQATCRRLVTEVFRKQEPDFWFNRVYKQYKRNIKPRKRFALLEDLLVGKRVLDVGCGDGLLSVMLAEHGYEPLMADILDWRDERSKNLPFVKMPNSTTLPLEDGVADTVLAFAMLHHLNAEDLPRMLGEFRRTGRRLIIEEDCHGIPETEAFRSVIERDAHLQAFMALSLDDQVRYSMLLDYFANALSQGVPEMNFPFEFKSHAEWCRTFEQHGFRIAQTRLLGFQKGNFNRACHMWYVLET